MGALSRDQSDRDSRLEPNIVVVIRNNRGHRTGAHVGVADPTHAAAHASPRGGVTNETQMAHAIVDAGAPSRPEAAIVHAQAKTALIGLGWKPMVAKAAIDAAAAAQGTDVTLERLIFESLRRCPVPRA